MGLKIIFWLTFLSFNLLTGAESPVREAEPPYPLIPNSYSLETYDANGNLTRQRDNVKDLTKRISIDSQDRITQIQDGNNAILGSYWYDESGFRIRKSSLEPKNNVFSNVEILYPSKFFGLEFIESENVISSVNNVYLNGVRIAALNEAGALAYYLTDQVDSVSTVLDDEGNTLSLMQYLPYGDTFVQRGDLNFSPKFNSQELDRESGFYFFNARFYDPGIARFTSADTIIDGELDTQGWNRFSYVKGNPIGAKDPTGHYSAEKFTSKPIEAAASKSGPQITGKATGILGRAVGILGLLFATSDLDAPGKDYPSKGTPPRNTSVTPEDAKKMRKQGLDPLNEKDINGSKSSGVSNKGNNTGNGGINSKISSSYKDVSENRTRVPNRGTDVSKSEFETNLRKNGWNEKLSDDGTANIFTKDNKKYTTRDNAKSTQGPTAEYFKDPSSKTANIKIRLKD
ncbi:RHS repeat-associated core domain-containing protein (plasmid) [Leptospira interrogans]|uniref:RHS repeat domain-containing protein n=1 Tax=Leptospira interrogans TaxID=173 RepID=UPI001F4D1933|nr:RHS repeat-associated core domain-containing protein [Leptospira interrogans]UNE69126.1 RHS repeat-associated core domain-containing protein [Leptospira interrogans]UNE69178.1 RHS repeat-associated core domain-containing protein [Leptospira interrogans]